MQHPMRWVCSVCKEVSWNMRLSKQYLMLWAVFKVVRIQYRSSLKNIYLVFLFSEFHVSVILQGSVNLYAVAYLTIMI